MTGVDLAGKFAVLLLACLTLGAAGPDGVITTFAGTGQKGYDGDGGPALKARLDSPFDVAFDPAGNLVFSDTFNHVLRRVEARSGIITTIAGRGSAGDSGDGGPAIEAALREPYGLAIDRAGTVYVADRLNRKIRRIDPVTKRISTVAGSGARVSSGDNGPATEAGLVEPNGLALDRAQTQLYIADVADHRVRVVDLPSGRITTFAGDGQGRHAGDGGPARAASLFGARAVKVGPDGSVYILERQGHALRKVDPTTGRIETIAGTGNRGYSGDGGPARDATFNGPKELGIDAAGHIDLVDSENNAIRRIDPGTGRIETIAGHGPRGGGGDGGPARLAELAQPHGVVVGPDGFLYMGDTLNHRIRRVALGGRD